MNTDFEAEATKTRVRFLKLLGKAANEGISFDLIDGKLEIPWENRIFTFAPSIAEACLKQGLAVRSDTRFAVTEQGKAYLLRMLHPEENFAAQHACVTDTTIQIDGNWHKVKTNENESPLARLYLRQGKDGKSWLNEHEFQAGEKLRTDFEKSQLQPRISANWVASFGSQGRGGNASVDISDFALDARSRVDGAIKAMGPDLAGVALDMCCFLKGLETIERERIWPPRSAKLMLRTALRELVRHYGFANKSPKQNMNTLIKHWATDDFRPVL